MSTGVAAVAFAGAAAWSFAQEVRELARFSSAAESGSLPASWAPLQFKNIARHTEYALVQDAGTTVVRARAAASASARIHPIAIDLDERTRIGWRWKIDALVPTSDLSKADADDAPARVQISFKLDESQLTLAERARIALARAFYGVDLPHSAIVYVWDRTLPVESVVPNPSTDRARAIVVESGPAHIGQWRTYSRDVLADYRKAFGSEPPRIAAVMLMTDTDNTGATVTAYYGDVTFERARTNTLEPAR